MQEQHTVFPTLLAINIRRKDAFEPAGNQKEKNKRDKNLHLSYTSIRKLFLPLLQA